MRRFFIFTLMENTSFLQALAVELMKKHQFKFDDVKVILPNKRARVFLLNELKSRADVPFFAPDIISIEEFISEISGVMTIDAVELLFVFYEVYLKICEERAVKADTFDIFSGWATMLLSDFNEIDRYLLKPDYVFSYLKNIEDIKHWAVDIDQRTEMISNYLHLWDLMPVYYEKLTSYLLAQHLGYQGLVYRCAVDGIQKKTCLWKEKTLYFAGFNALNRAEEQIVQFLLNEGVARVFWDIDRTFLEDPYHEAGYFAREIKKKWSYYKTHAFEGIIDEFKKEKTIEIISTPKSVGQAKIAGNIVSELIKKGQDMHRTALVLGEEKLLTPLLYALPKQVGALNITMGYESKANPVQLFLQKWFKMHLNAFNRDQERTIFYHKEIEEVLSHPLLASVGTTSKVIRHIHKNNLTFFPFQYLKHHFIADTDTVLQFICEPWPDNVYTVVQRMLDILFMLKTYLEKENDTVSLAFLFSVYQTVNKMKSYIETYRSVATLEQLFVVYRQMTDLTEVAFEGEPLQGLQIMGVLESRVLDFETVIITSVNEGKFPSGKSNNSFIPYDIKRELGLPTYKEKDAIYTYHFYHLLQRAKTIYLIYNSDSEGLDAGEKSRFITQLQLEPQKKHQIKSSTYFAHIPDSAYQPIEILKSVRLQAALKEVATGKGFSPSALANYLRNPVGFYFQRILRIRDAEEVEENIALNTLGTIIHNVLENLFKPYVGLVLEVEHFDEMLGKMTHEIEEQFNEVYAASGRKIGKNLLAFEVAKRHVFHFLQMEKKAVVNGSHIQILALETELKGQMESERLPYPVNISGVVDRIEIRDGFLRIIDYKTGKVEKRSVHIGVEENITSDLKYDKIIQLLGYALMYESPFPDLPLQVAIYSFKNRKEGYLLFSIKDAKKTVTDTITPDIISGFREQLIDLILEILNPSIPFKETVN